MNENPFGLWQDFWKNVTPAPMTPLLPPMSAEETARKINELKSIEAWLNFNLQALKSQITLLEQQKVLHESMGVFQESIQRAMNTAAQTTTSPCPAASAKDKPA